MRRGIVMHGFTESRSFHRRATDSIAKEDDCCSGLAIRVSILERHREAIDTAFVLDDLGKPDFGGHRGGHLSLKKAAAVVDGYKQDATRAVLKWLMAGILFMFMGGIGAWISGHMK
jgi:hypothetical protein